MKKCVSVFMIAFLLTAFAVIANAAKETVDILPGRDWDVINRQAAIPGHNDKRIITPAMNNQERYETMRNIKKRAAAKRNSLLQQAVEQKKAQKRAGSPGQIPAE